MGWDQGADGAGSARGLYQDPLRAQGAWFDRATMVSRVKEEAHQGLASLNFFCCRRFPSVETIFSIPCVKPAQRRAFMYLRQKNRILSTHFFLTFAAGISLTNLFYRGFALKIKDFRRALLLCLRE